MGTLYGLSVNGVLMIGKVVLPHLLPQVTIYHYFFIQCHSFDVHCIGLVATSCGFANFFVVDMISFSRFDSFVGM